MLREVAKLQLKGLLSHCNIPGKHKLIAFILYQIMLNASTIHTSLYNTATYSTIIEFQYIIVKYLVFTFIIVPTAFYITLTMKIAIIKL